MKITNRKNEYMAILGLVVLVVLLIVLGPLATIWAINTLFPIVAIPYTFWNWLAVIVLGAFLRANVTVKKD
jgi:hypothetical protein